MTRYWFSVLLVAASLVSSMADPSTHAIAYYAPKPEYPTLPDGSRPEGSGVFVLHIDLQTGRVKSVSVEKSTGFAILDKAAIDSYKKWRFNRWAAPIAKCPITFTTHGLPSGWKFEQ
jgi:TonB family protein